MMKKYIIIDLKSMIQSKINKSTRGLFPFVLPFFTILFFSLFSFDKEEDLKKIIFSWNFPFADSGGGVLEMKDSMPIYYYNNYILYGMGYEYSIYIDEAKISKERRYDYLIWKEKEKYGYYFKYKNYKASRKVAIDSFNKEHILGWKVSYNDNEKLIASFKDKSKKYNLIEKYLTQDIKDQSYSDTITFYYTDKIKDSKFSLAKNLDSIKKLKVAKIVHHYNAQVYKGNSFRFPERDLIVSFREDTISNPKKILEIFNYYKDKK